jgi:tRNA (cmo5U34)-methyltransferase
MSDPYFDDPELVKRRAQSLEQFVPGYRVMQRMAAQLLAEQAGRDAEILVLGAGGGLELETFAGLEPRWRFTGVDPAPEMIKAARFVVDAAGAGERVSLIEGLIDDAPDRPFDGATCLLTLHFVPDDGGKLETLQLIRQRLKPGAAFVLVDLCIGGPDADRLRDRYATSALMAGAEAGDVASTKARLVEMLHTVSPSRDEALLAEAGFKDIDLFYAALSWRGWAARA